MTLKRALLTVAVVLAVGVAVIAAFFFYQNVLYEPTFYSG